MTATAELEEVPLARFVTFGRLVQRCHLAA